MTIGKALPAWDQIEVNFFGPGYGESILLHVGNGRWVVIDSCMGTDSRPVALSYFEALKLNPVEAVRLIVATHWHDDHVRGMGKLVEACKQAEFCCASALCEKEFLACTGAMAGNSVYSTGSGMQELYQTFSVLKERNSNSILAVPNRLIFQEGDCEIWSLSPSDRMCNIFLQNIASLISQEGETRRRIPSVTPNKAAVVLLVKIGETAILLGADLEKYGWLEILNNQVHPNGKASVFKIPHHGSQNAHEDGVWNEMLLSEPIAVLSPWRVAGRKLPTKGDITRILSCTPKSYATVSQRNPGKYLGGPVARTVRESGAKISPIGLSRGMIRLRRQFGLQATWETEVFPPACALQDI